MHLRNTTTSTHGFSSFTLSSLRTRAVCLSLVLLLPLMVFIGASLIQRQSYVMQVTEERTGHFTQLIQTEYERTRETASQVLETLALHTITATNCEAILSGVVVETIASINLVDANNTSICTTGTPPDLQLMTVDHPINDGAQTLVATLSLDWILDWLVTAQLPLDMVIHVVDGDGMVMESLSRSALPTAPGTFDTSDFTAETFRRDGSIYGVRQLETDAYLLVEVPRSLVSAEVNTLFIGFIGWGVLLTVMFAAFAWYQSSRMIVHPLNKLDGLVKQLAQGNFAVRSELPHSLVELNRLGLSIDQLAKAFETDRTTLENQKLQLEAINDAEREEKMRYQTLNTLLLYLAYRADRESKARWDAQQADERKLQFLGMIAHELRTPLTSVKGFATTLLADDVTWKPEQQREFLSIIDEEADLMLDLVEQLLDVSQIESGRLSTHRVEGYISEVVEDALPHLQRLAEKHHLIVNVEDALPMLAIDQRRIQQVLTNLVSNAAKYSPAGGNIIVDVYTNTARDVVRVDVSDEGPGIPMIDKQRLFKPFNRAHPPNIQGVGLGLVICRGIIEAHEGRIWISDHEPQGTTFSFEIPATH